jgi:hypothetical protein
VSQLKLGTIYGDVFAERVVGNLINFKTFCESCKPTCSDCRVAYGSFVGDITGLVRVASSSGGMVDNPRELLKGARLHQCDLLMLVGVHHDLLASAEILVEETGAKAIIVPVEDSTWLPPGLRIQVKANMNDIGIESAFPKPFCTLDFGEGKLIDEFIKTYRIGLPICKAEIKNDIISEIHVERSAPCGCSWYVAQKIRGHNITDREGLFDTIAKAHHAYPCTGSMNVDRELGDALLHIAGYNARQAICNAVGIEDCFMP